MKEESCFSEAGSEKGVVNSSKLSVWLKGIYGAGYLGQETLQNGFFYYIMLFYTDVVRLRPEYIGIALSVGRLYDAFTDPLMGQISDKTNTRFGRRRPYIMGGSIFWGIIFVLIWMASPYWSQGGKFAYLVLMDILFATGVTIVQTPYMALGAELSLDYDERSSITAYRTMFFLLGQIAAASMLNLAGFFKGYLPHSSNGNGSQIERVIASLPNADWSITAILIAVIAVPLMFLAGLIPKERFATRSAQEFTLWEAFKTTLANANYRRVVATHAAAWLLTSLGSFLLPYIIIYYLKKPLYMVPLLAFAAVAGVGTLPLWVRLGHVLEKSVVLRIAGAWLSLLCPLVLVLINPSYPWLVFILAMWGGSGQAALYTYSFSMVGDVTDEDELQTGHRREGMFFGVYTFTLKFVISLGLLWSGFGLALIGYIPNAEQSAGTLLGMRLLYAIPCLSFLGGFVFLRRYSLDRTRLEEIHATLEKKQIKEINKGGLENGCSTY